MVPAVDGDGNETGGVRLPDIAAPLGTHTGWNLRREGFAPGELALLGSYLPFARTAAERLASGDPRPSLEERYRNHDAYVEAVATRRARAVRSAPAAARGRRALHRSGAASRQVFQRYVKARAGEGPTNSGHPQPATTVKAK